MMVGSHSFLRVCMEWGLLVSDDEAFSALGTV